MINNHQVCKNCAEQYNGKFCPNCGQSSDVGRLNKKYLAKDLMKLFGSTESGKFYLLKELFKDPGSVARGYISGQRKKYYNPIQFYLYTTAAMLFISYRLKISEMIITGDNAAELEMNKRFMSFIYTYINAVEFFILPLFTFFTLLLFKRTGYNYSELFVVNTYSAAQRQIVSIFFFIVLFFMPAYIGLMNTVSIIFNSAMIIWFYLSFFSELRKSTTIIRSLLLAALYYLSVILILLAAYRIFLFLN